MADTRVIDWDQLPEEKKLDWHPNSYRYPDDWWTRKGSVDRCHGAVVGRYWDDPADSFRRCTARVYIAGERFCGSHGGPGTGRTQRPTAGTVRDRRIKGRRVRATEIQLAARPVARDLALVGWLSLYGDIFKELV